MRHFVRGLRSGLILFRTSPATALAALTALALGIGFSTTMFAIVHGGTRPLPFDDPDSIVAIGKVARGPEAVTSTTVADYTQWQAAPALSGIGAFTSQSVNLTLGEGTPERVAGSALTASTFELTGVYPVVGRAFRTEDETAAAPVVLLSWKLWQSRFAGSRAVIDQTVRLDGHPHTVIGVMPERFGFPVASDLWTPLPTGRSEDTRTPVQVFGRMSEGMTRPVVGDSLLAISAAAAPELRDGPAAIAIDVIPFTYLETPREVIAGLYVLLLAVTGVLVIACVNVANLFIARAITRSRDVAVRLALGATRRAVLIEQAAETLALSSVAGVVGLGIAAVGTRYFRENTGHIIEAFWVDFRLDPAVVAYAFLLAVVAAAGAAVLPGLRAGRTDVVTTLRDGGYSATGGRIGRVSRALVSGQIAFACGLLALTLLLGQSALTLYGRAWPFNPDTLLSTNLGLSPDVMNRPEARQQTLVSLAEAIEQLQGPGTGAIASALPGRGGGNWSFSLDQANPRPTTTTTFTLVSPGYFDVLGGRLRRGRTLEWSDRPGAPLAAVVNDSFVSRYSADQDVIGRQVFLGTRAYTIVGVVNDLMPGAIDRKQQDGVYGAILQSRPYSVRAMVAGAQTPAQTRVLTSALEAAVHNVDPDIALFETFSVREAALREKEVLGVLSSLFGLFGLAALALTSIGLYSVMTFVTAQRTREFGIRLALGATAGDLIRLVAAQGARQVSVGLGIGVLLAFVLTRAFAAAVEIVQVPVVPLLSQVVGALGVAAILALVGPIVRATRVTGSILSR